MAVESIAYKKYTHFVKDLFEIIVLCRNVISNPPILLYTYSYPRFSVLVYWYWWKWNYKTKHLSAAQILSFCIPVIFVHASLRLRNMKNKLENKMETAGLKTSPMGILLEALGQQEENLSKVQDFLESKLKEWLLKERFLVFILHDQYPGVRMITSPKDVWKYA